MIEKALRLVERRIFLLTVQLSTIRKTKRLQLTITNIPVSNLVKVGNKYIVFIKDKNVQLKVEFTEKLFNDYGEKGITGNSFSFRKDKINSSFYQLRYKIDIEKVLSFAKSNSYKINYVAKKGIKVYGMLAINIDKLSKKYADLTQSAQKASKNKKKNAGKQKKKEHANQMLEALNRYEQKNKGRISKNTNEIDEKKLARKKIYLNEFENRRTCGNCVYFIGGKCTFHNLKVTINHGCYKFRPYRTVYGGGFSPR